MEIADCAVEQDAVARVEQLRCSVRRSALPDECGVPPTVAEVVGRQGVLEWRWTD
jgi:hypothetical protein